MELGTWISQQCWWWPYANGLVSLGAMQMEERMKQSWVQIKKQDLWKNYLTFSSIFHSSPSSAALYAARTSTTMTSISSSTSVMCLLRFPSLSLRVYCGLEKVLFSHSQQFSFCLSSHLSTSSQMLICKALSTSSSFSSIYASFCWELSIMLDGVSPKLVWQQQVNFEN